MTETREPAILIVDDDPMAIHALYSAVAGIGSIRYANSGFEALQMLEAAEIDLVLTDTNMPGMDGYETCRAVRAMRPEMPVIFVTGSGAPGDEVAALEAGAVDFITKPVNPPVVRARIGLQLRLQDLYRREAGARRSAEEQRARLASTLDTLLDPHMVLEAVRDEDGLVQDFRCVYANGAAAAYYGRDTAVMPGTRLLTLDPHLTGSELFGHYQAAMASDEPVALDSVDCPGTRNAIRKFDIRATRSGATLNLTWRDVTDRYLADLEREARAARDLQVRKAEGLNRMAGAVAHLYNNLLGALIGHLELAREALPGADPAQEELEAALEAAERAAQLSGTLLAYVGQAPGRLDPLDLSQACAMVLPRLRAGLPPGVHLSADLPEPGPTVPANAGLLEQALAHLVENAAEAMGPGGGLVRLSVRVEDDATAGLQRIPTDWLPDDRPHAALEVADGGCGMDEATLAQAFDPFFTTKFTGRGLGLATVAGMARRHGGGVAVESAPGRGSRFRLVLPVAEAAPAPPQPPTPPAARRGGVVLLVDDEPAFLRSTRALLTRLGYTVLEAADGDAALAAYTAAEGRVDCLVSDVSMPAMDGWELLAKLRGLRPGLPSLLMSGYDQAEAMAGEHAEWPDGYLSKPFRLEELRGALLRAMAPPVER